MTVAQTGSELSEMLDRFRSGDRSIGLVPTMGALHEGHLTLVDQALKDNEITVVSIFVNPTQFNDKGDLDKYPRNLDRDMAFLSRLDTERIIVFAPSVKDIYPTAAVSESYSFDGLEFEMEGKFRSGHFNGVATVVRRLLEIVRPAKAYFGKKDFQQFRIIQSLVDQLKLDLEVIGVEIHREANGLAMSSRNERLRPEYRKAAPFIFETLTKAREKFGTKSAGKVTEWVKKQFDKHPLLKLEYFMITDEKSLKPIVRKSKRKSCRAFIAVFAGGIRLIDNIALN